MLESLVEGVPFALVRDADEPMARRFVARIAGGDDLRDGAIDRARLLGARRIAGWRQRRRQLSDVDRQFTRHDLC
ncbi:MAG: hypothetical protein R3F21_21475 [Myxococcota bacterium]